MQLPPAAVKGQHGHPIFTSTSPFNTAQVFVCSSGMPCQDLNTVSQLNLTQPPNKSPSLQGSSMLS